MLESKSGKCLFRKRHFIQSGKHLIQVYNDKGTSRSSQEQLNWSLSQCLSPQMADIKQFSGKTLRSLASSTKQESLTPTSLDSTDLLCFGGGYDLGYLETLEQPGCDLIRSYIQKGGRYLGLCAGAYFAASQCHFDRNGQMPVCGPRFIRLFEGDAVGPELPGFKYNSEEGAHAVRLELAPHLRDTELAAHMPLAVNCYFNGGCHFESSNWRDTCILYRYADTNQPAIIAARLGDGWGLLSGVHIEYSPSLLAKQYAEDTGLTFAINSNAVTRLKDASQGADLIDLLKIDEVNRNKLFTFLVNHLLHDSYEAFTSLAKPKDTTRTRQKVN